MITLYHSPFTRSHLIRFALEELGLNHELRRLDVSAAEHKAPAYLALNPLGQLPTLVDGGVAIREAAAIALHLGDRAPDRGLAPGVGSALRAHYYQWVVFSVATELPALAKIALHTRVLPEPLRQPAIADAGRDEWLHIAGSLAVALRGKRFLLGGELSLADVMVGGSLWLANFLGVLSPHPTLATYFERVSDRPAFQRAYADSVPA